MAHCEVSPFFREQLPALREAARRGPVLDVASGRGRHALAAARHGLACVALDRSAEALDALAAAARRERLRVRPLRADLERGHGLPFRPAAFGAVLVFRYLWRPLAPALEAALAPGGLLLYETFTIRQRDLPHGPGNPAFLLQPGELPALFPGLALLGAWEGVHVDAEGRPWHLARLAARRAPARSGPAPPASGAGPRA